MNRIFMLVGIVTVFFFVGCDDSRVPDKGREEDDDQVLDPHGEKALAKMDAVASMLESGQSPAHLLSQIGKEILTVTNAFERSVLIGKYEKLVAKVNMPIVVVTNSVTLNRALLVLNDLHESTLQTSYKARGSRLECIGFVLAVVECFDKMIAQLEELARDDNLENFVAGKTDELNLCLNAVQNAKAMWISRHIDFGGYLKRDFWKLGASEREVLLRDIEKVLKRVPAWCQKEMLR